MIPKKRTGPILYLIFLTLGLLSCTNIEPDGKATPIVKEKTLFQHNLAQLEYYTLNYDINVGHYFEFMDTLVAFYDSLHPYPISEHHIVHSNPWLIDTLANTDYYVRMARGEFVYDPQQLVVLPKGTNLLIPDSIQVHRLKDKFEHTILDLNIPEFKLRILEKERVQQTFSVRVGRVERKYLEMAGHVVDLRTRIGTGSIVRINRKPDFINPSDNKVYETTGRDDGRRTLLPRIPWLEPELNGWRHGQLIHPTTNPKTLDKAYSNGCVGVREGDMWRIYYHAPLGTKVRFRYHLYDIFNPTGSTRFKDIYPDFRKYQQRVDQELGLPPDSTLQKPVIICECCYLD